jgi:DNA-binding transcriptional regulator YdaS (Cro superfamily)
MSKSLRGLIVAHYGSQKAAAERLGVHQITVSHWLRHRPEGFYTKLPMMHLDGVDMTELHEAIQAQIKLKQHGYTG